MYIDGSWTSGSGTWREPIINPATEEVIGHVPLADVADLDRALAAAARGFAVWRDTPIETRSRILLEAARLVRERAGRIGEIMTLEQGKGLAKPVAKWAAPRESSNGMSRRHAAPTAASFPQIRIADAGAA